MIFSAPVHTGPGAYPAACTTGTGSFTDVKRPGCGVNHPPPSSAEAKERVELYIYAFLYLHGRLKGELFYLTLISLCGSKCVAGAAARVTYSAQELSVLRPVVLLATSYDWMTINSELQGVWECRSLSKVLFCTCVQENKGVALSE